MDIGRRSVKNAARNVYTFTHQKGCNSMNEDTVRLTDSQRALVESNLGLARMVAWKNYKYYEQLGMDWDDVFSVACLGLMRAARTFNSEKSKASTYLTCGCKSELRMELRRQRARSRSAFATVSLQESYGRRGATEQHIEDLLVSNDPLPEDAAIDAETEAHLRQVLKCMRGTKKGRALSLRVNGKTQPEIAQILGCSQSNVSRMLSSMRKLLMEEIAS